MQSGAPGVHMKHKGDQTREGRALAKCCVVNGSRKPSGCLRRERAASDHEKVKSFLLAVRPPPQYPGSEPHTSSVRCPMLEASSHGKVSWGFMLGLLTVWQGAVRHKQKACQMREIYAG